MKANKLAALTVISIGMIAGSGSIKADSSDWYIGAGGGINVSNLRYSNLDKNFYPDGHSNLSGLFSIFAEYDFGPENSIGIRPQFSFLTRGGRISGIGQDYYQGYFLPESNPNHLDDVFYSLKATYFDFRVPVMYQFGNTEWPVRPYVYVAPVLGFVTKGKTKGQFNYVDGQYTGVEYKMTKANMNPFYFAGAVGLGLKWQLNVADSKMFIGLDFNYQFGFTNTYGKKEKDGTLENIATFGDVFPKKVTGNRKINSYEITASIGVPLSIFSKKRDVAPVREYVEVPVYQPVPVVVEKKPCYALYEILEKIDNGENVQGLKICAIDDNINFEFGKSDIQRSSYSYLNSLADLFKKTGMKVRISGHTDNVGSPESNMELSRKRTMEVVKYLLNSGVPAENITYEWFGLTQPIAPNTTEEGRRQNRRVEFEILNN